MYICRPLLLHAAPRINRLKHCSSTLSHIRQFSAAHARGYTAYPMIGIAVTLLRRAHDEHNQSLADNGDVSKTVNADSVLLVQRAHDPLAGKWGLCGGRVRLGETYQQAAARELYEEVGIKLGENDIGDVFCVTQYIERDSKEYVKWHYKLLHVYGYVPHDTKLQPGTDASDAVWASIDRVSNKFSLSGVNKSVRENLISDVEKVVNKALRTLAQASHSPCMPC